MPLIRLGGREVHVQEVGDGPVVVMLHGLVWSDLSSMYLSIAPRLADRRRVVLYDLRGHGRSEPARRGFDLDTLSDDLASVIDRFAPAGESVDLVGHSYGGTIALEAAMGSDASIRRVAAIDSPVPPFTVTDESDVLRLASGRAAGGVGSGPGAFADVWSKLGWDGAGRRAGRWTERLERFRHETTVVEDLGREAPWSSAELASIDVPVLLIRASESPLRSSAIELERRIPGARAVELPGDHLIHLRRPREVARAIERFLDE